MLYGLYGQQGTIEFSGILSYLLIPCTLLFSIYLHGWTGDMLLSTNLLNRVRSVTGEYVSHTEVADSDTSEQPDEDLLD
jgi:hypothetical protein